MEEKGNIVVEKSYSFALRIVAIYQFLQNQKKEFVLSKQLLRSGTSIGSNVEEAVGAYSKPDFASKMSIAYKEARETHYWLRLLRDSGFISNDEAEKMLIGCDELLKILGTIIKTSKQR
jgi:four helix bundle protein